MIDTDGKGWKGKEKRRVIKRMRSDKRRVTHGLVCLPAGFLEVRRMVRFTRDNGGLGDDRGGRRMMVDLSVVEIAARS